jgi:hypothetical protein
MNEIPVSTAKKMTMEGTKSCPLPLIIARMVTVRVNAQMPTRKRSMNPERTCFNRFGCFLDGGDVREGSEVESSVGMVLSGRQWE